MMHPSNARMRARSVGPMPKLLTRVVSLLVIPCLLLDPVTASLFSSPVSLLQDKTAAPIHNRFQEEALAEKFVWILNSFSPFKAASVRSMVPDKARNFPSASAQPQAHPTALPTRSTPPDAFIIHLNTISTKHDMVVPPAIRALIRQHLQEGKLIGIISDAPHDEKSSQM